MNVPDDFPSEPDTAALAGAQPKLSARLVNGKYLSGYTAEERGERYAICVDLVLQLAKYYERKKKERQELSREQLLSLIAQALPTRGWGLSQAEIRWCMREMAAAIPEDE